MKLVQSFSELFSAVGPYATIACDIYGVLHDGFHAYPYTQSALVGLKELGHKVILLSNSSRMYPALSHHLDTKFALPPASYDDIVSSGRLSRLFLQDCYQVLVGNAVSPPSCFASLRNATMTAHQFCKIIQNRRKINDVGSNGSHSYRFYVAGDIDYLEPLYRGLEAELEPIFDWTDADFVLLGSVRPLYEDPAFDKCNKASVARHYDAMLRACHARQLPMICVNPDVLAPHGTDEHGNPRLLVCPGFIGELYEALGGSVLYFGKPFASIYDYLVHQDGQTPHQDDQSPQQTCNDARKTLCVGDNVATDVLGAREANQDVVLILGGVHGLADAIDDPDALKARVRQLCIEAGTPEPTYLMPYLRY
ncbi:HAD-like domain-containing protein [Gongronella butleri]|nr:HAD-like domain-containing protein [Gongronella butleri]